MIPLHQQNNLNMENINFEEIVTRQKISSRGGGIEIDLTSLGFRGEKMSAYQNYLGGGLLGRVCSDHTLKYREESLEDEEVNKLESIADKLKRYFHSLTNPDTEWENFDFEQNQNLPVSGY